MPDYCTPADLARFGVNAEAIASVGVQANQRPPIAESSALMDGYLASQFKLPLVSWGSDITGCCAVIAAYTVLRVRGLKPGENPEDNALYLEYKERLRWLEQIAAGKIHPVVKDSSSEAAGVSPARPFMASNAQRGYFNEDPSCALPFQGRRR